MIYLDWAATGLPDTSVQERALAASVEAFGNPSSAHSIGGRAKILLESARKSLLESISHKLASATVAPSAELAFTGSGTEADQIPLLSLLSRPIRGSAPHIIVSSIEHAAIHAQALALAKLGIEVSLVDPCEDGIVDPEKVASALRPSTRLVSVMAVNNETGAIQKTEELAKRLQSWSASGSGRAISFHVDCVQALGKIPPLLPIHGVTSAAFSAHKLGAPKGLGALAYFSPLEALAQGGAQEKGIRSGTENLFGALAFAEAAKNATNNLNASRAHAESLTERLILGLASIQGALALPLGRKPVDGRYSPWIASLAFPGLSGEVLARSLSDAGIAVSTGSACAQSASAKRSSKGRRILQAMRVPEDIAFGAIRVSIGGSTSASEIDEFLEKAADLYRRLKT
jgi:cysteine desulfurase